MKKKLLFLLLYIGIWQQNYGQTFSNGGINYEIISSTATVKVIRTTTISGAVTIPTSVNYNGQSYSVTTIDAYAFGWNAGITSVVIPNTVTTIGDYAFNDCGSLTSVTIPNSVTYIGEYAFSFCNSLTTITIPESVTYIGSAAFGNCTSLTSVTCKAISPPPIFGDVFYGVNVSAVSLTVPIVSDQAYQSDSLWGLFGTINTFGSVNTTTVAACPTGYTWSNNNQLYAQTGIYNGTPIGDVFQQLDLTIIYNFTVDGIIYSILSPTTVAVDDGTNNVTGNVIIPATLTTSCGSYEVTEIKDDAFAGNTGLTSVTIPNSVIEIGDDAFAGCVNLTSVTIPTSVTYIGSAAFQDCASLTSITIPNSVTSIRRNAFEGCTSLTSIIIPNSVTSVRQYAFEGCISLTSVTIPNSVTDIYYNAFAGCTGLTSITIPESVTYIDAETFVGCTSLTTVSIPNSITDIYYAAFKGCVSLPSITLPESISYIDDEAFADCTSLTSVICNVTSPIAISPNVFTNVNQAACNLIVPASSVAVYQATPVWQDFNFNDTPTNIALSTSSISENNAANAVVGTLSSTDVDAGDTHTYTLVSGTGDTDNASFTIVGNQLKVTPILDFETKTSYSVRIKTIDAGGLSFEKVFTITVNDINETPNNIALSTSSISENNAANAVVGTLSSTDVDAGDTHTYTLVSGTGDTDNASFTIVGNQLKVTPILDFETKTSYSVRIKTIDAGGLSFEKVFTITVNDINETPTNIALSTSSISENNAANAVVGTLSSTDVDAGDTHTYTLVSGTGDTDNASFTIVGNQLKATSVFDFETKASYSILVRTTDAGGLSFEKVFTITIVDVVENVAPTNINLSSSFIDENNAANAVVGTLSSTDVDAGDTHTYTLVSGTGDTDNASFTIVGNQLKVTPILDFETKTSYSVRIKTTDAGGLSFEKVFTITVNDINEDRDGDGVFDDRDNCTLTPNANQADNDQDGIGDVCDSDDDNDDVLDSNDNCPMTSNTDQADRDRDGQGDVCDTVELNVAQALTPNGDGINDTWVIYNLGNHPGTIVRVFNSNGTQVFHSANYQNNWTGNYEGRNEMLPVGSYMFQIDLGGDGSIDSQGWMYISK